MTDDIRSSAARSCLNTPVEKLEVEGGERDRGARRRQELRVRPRDLLAAAAQHRRHGEPAPAPEVLAAAKGLRYRDFLTVVAGARRGGPLPRQLDLHPRARRRASGRIQNFRSWSPWMVPGPDQGLRRPGVLLLRGRRAVGDGRRRPRRARHARARAARPGRARDQVERGFATRVPKAYPMYDADYAERVADDPRPGSTGSTTSSRSAATGCTATTTRTTRCSPRCARWTTS